VLGSPIAHSLSPTLHNAAYLALGLTWWRYEAVECDEARLPAFLDSCGPDWVGLSLTMPLKRSVLPLLDRADPLVTEVGGANTVLFAAAQRLGYNTDVPGMVRALAAHGITTGPAVILGGGATACAALAALRDLGEQSATVAARDLTRVGEVRNAAQRLGMNVEFRPFEPDSLAGMSLVISTVPAGAADCLAKAAVLGGVVAVFDVVYRPWPTALATAASRAGATVIGGLDLLVQQAAIQVEIMTGRPAPLAEMHRAGLAELRQQLPPGSSHALRLRGEHDGSAMPGRQAEDHLGHLPPGQRASGRWRVVGSPQGEPWPGAPGRLTCGASRGDGRRPKSRRQVVVAPHAPCGVFSFAAQQGPGRSWAEKVTQEVTSARN
jgi:shikimate dehydrogenase